MSNLQVVSDYRGTFEQNSLATLMLKITTFNGIATDPESISIAILDENENEINSGTPEKITKGFYIYDWMIDADRQPGNYTVRWDYVESGVFFSELQSVIVVADGDNSPIGPYNDRIAAIRMALEIHLGCAQAIPVYDEQGIVDTDGRTVKFTFSKWNQNRMTRIYRNQKPVTSGVLIDYFKGQVVFDQPLTDYDTVNADYNFRWYSDEELERFLLNALSMYNSFPPVSNTKIERVPDRAIPAILYGASKDAIRQLLFCLQFQQPKEVFGGPEAAQSTFGNLETLKQNFEGDFKLLLENKKFIPYTGRTKMAIVPEFTMPGGRSRWFRYMFGGFSL